MDKVKTAIIFTFFLFTTWSVQALPGEGAQKVEGVEQGGAEISIEKVKEAAKAQREMAEAICEGNREGIVDEQLSELMKVGLYNYCDQYTDEDRFCGCVGESTYEQKVTDEDLKKFDENLIKESKKNIALNSFKALKEYREEKNREIANMPSSNNGMKYLDSYSRQTCDDSKTLMEEIKPFCKESDLLALKESFSDSLKDCKNCVGMDIDSMPQAPELRKKRTSGEDFIYFPTHWVNESFLKQTDADAFKLNEINKRYPNNDSKYKSLGNFQHKELVENIARRLQAKWRGTDANLYAAVGLADYQRRMDTAFLVSMKNFYLFKGIDNFPNKPYFYTNDVSLKKSVGEYIDYFSEQYPNKIFQRSKVELPQIIASLENFMEDKQNEKLNNKCEKLVKTMKDSCAAISDPKPRLSFSLNEETAKKVRENRYKNDKFKFDQLYCVAKNKSESRVFDSIFKRYGSFFSNSSKKLVDESKPLNAYAILNFEDEKLNNVDFSTGVSMEMSETLATGKRNQIVDLYVAGSDESDKENLSLSFDWRNYTGKGTGALLNPTNSYGGGNVINWGGGSFVIDVSKFYNSSPVDNAVRDIIDRALSNPNPEGASENIPKAIVVEEPQLANIPVEDAISDATESVKEVASTVDTPVESGEEISDFESTNLERSEVPSVVESKSSFDSSVPLDTKPVMNFNSNSNTSDFMLGNTKFNNRQQEERELSKEELMEKRIQDLEERLQNSATQQITKIDNSKSREVNPTENSFSKENTTTKDQLELNKLKVDLEKMKLELAKSELELKKAEKKKKKERVPASTRESVSKLDSNSLERENSKSVFSSTRSKRAAEASSTPQRSASRSSQSSTESQSSTPNSAPSQYSSSTSSAGGSLDSEASRGSSSIAPRSSSGALLSATQIEDSQLQNSSNVSVVSYQNINEVRSADQSELAKLYSEYGTEVITQGGTEIILEKDERTGEIKVIEKDKTSAAVIEKVLSKRAPASVKKEPVEEKKARKRFSLQDFNEIIDNGVKKE
ncbi:hypothetical protein [Halobacteriovorax sp. JY17]|uniref:hypothetical protein n=1 Tax=Halobacteriovorax sp. JY17 TaxID=2014617 RepID=UPI000C580372|nr:hypothetical protein [Halobacteriovorax sp. JY17]PIK16118.1 MAG: hypothetical protein CES88_05130 [Halobacteriovorax sp. JY17]